MDSFLGLDNTSTDLSDWSKVSKLLLEMQATEKQSCILKNLFYRAEAVTLYAESGGNKREARRRFIRNHPGIHRNEIPDCNFFVRNSKKFKAKHTVKNVVSFYVFENHLQKTFSTYWSAASISIDVHS